MWRVEVLMQVDRSRVCILEQVLYEEFKKKDKTNGRKYGKTRRVYLQKPKVDSFFMKKFNNLSKGLSVSAVLIKGSNL
ncbi:hypothetical protein [Peribacillus loiseleuriae]|uniref:hypothetical protein n=1 Tax=Peribacillus loiseleuriae TaxID=1679170 RepID=UPI003D01CFBC